MEKIEHFHSEVIQQYISSLRKHIQEEYTIDPKYFRGDIKLGLRNSDGTGVPVGVSQVGSVQGYTIEDGIRVPAPGRLYYRGIELNEIVEAHRKANTFGFEEVAYLLLFGELPDANQLKQFRDILAANRRLPTNFTRDVIMKAPSNDIMNSLTRSVLTLASYDDNCSDTSIENVLRQCMSLIGVFPMLAVYAYHAYNHYQNDDSMYIHRPSEELSAAENLLMMLRPDREYTELEAKVLDIALVLHMEHGGGNNSTFTTRVVTSSGSDTYSVIAAALSSLKGPKHGGANIKVVEMMRDIESNVSDCAD